MQKDDGVENALGNKNYSFSFVLHVLLFVEVDVWNLGSPLKNWVWIEKS